MNETNKYAVQKGKELNASKSEIYVLFGALLLSAHCRLPNKRKYWSSEDNVPKILQNSIRRDRFENILRSIHLVDNTLIAGEDRAAKLRPLITHLQNKFKERGTNWQSYKDWEFAT